MVDAANWRGSAEAPPYMWQVYENDEINWLVSLTAGVCCDTRRTPGGRAIVVGLELSADREKSDLTAKCAALSPREIAVLRGLAKFQNPKEIARDLDISFNTVRGYINEARQKLGVRSQRDAAWLFAEYETLQLPHQFVGDQFGWVAVPQPDEALSDSGYSRLPQIDQDVGPFGGSGPEAQHVFSPGMPPQDSPLGRERSPGDKMVFAKTNHGEDGDVARPGLRKFSIHRWLELLGFKGWLGLIVLLTLLVIAAFGIATVSLLGIFEVLQQIGGQHR